MAGGEGGSAKELQGIVPLVKFTTLVRIILPSCLATGVVYKLGDFKIDLINLRDDLLRVHDPAVHSRANWTDSLLLGLVFLFSAVVVNFGSDKIYEVYEGRSHWPAWFSNYWLRKQQRRVSKLLSLAEAAEKRGDRLVYNELWSKLRIYPEDDDGDPVAKYPTALGNVLAGYEAYPLTRYGMDSVFFWPRLWFLLDKDRKEAIENQWSVADGLLSLSAVSFVGGMAWMAAVVVHYAGSRLMAMGKPAATGFLKGVSLPFSGPIESLGGAFGLLVFGYLIYRLSLPSHRANGEIFKSIFDLYRGRLEVRLSIGGTEKENWGKTWLYLQYLSVRCRNCGESVPANKETCINCAYPISKSLADSEDRAPTTAEPRGSRGEKLIHGFCLVLDALFPGSDAYSTRDRR